MRPIIHTYALLVFAFVMSCQTTVGQPSTPEGHEIDPLPHDSPSDTLVQEIVSQDVVTLQLLYQLADQVAPAIVIARYRLEASEGSMVQSTLLPNPSLEVSHNDLILDGPDEGLGIARVVVSQPIPVGGRRKASEQVSRSEREQRYHEYLHVRRETFLELRETYLEIVLYRDLSDLSWHFIEEATETKELLSTQSASESAILRATVPITEQTLELARLASEEAFAHLRLKDVLGGVEVDADRIKGRLLDRMVYKEMWQIDESWITEHHRLLASDAVLDVARDTIGALEAEIVPDVVLFGGAGYDSRRDEPIGTVGLRVALPVFSRNQGRLIEAESDLARVSVSRTDLETRLRSQLEELEQAINEQDTILQGYREDIVPTLKRALDLAREDYVAGRTTFVDLLDAQDRYFEAYLTQIDASYKLSISHAELREFRDDLEVPLFRAESE